MPNLNKKGPMGEGPMTGRKMGRCTNYCAGRNNQTTQENENRENPINETAQVQGQGLGRDRGMRRSGGGGGRGTGMGRRFRDNIQE